MKISKKFPSNKIICGFFEIILHRPCLKKDSSPVVRQNGFKLIAKSRQSINDTLILKKPNPSIDGSIFQIVYVNGCVHICSLE